ncbi:mrna cleavage and polyadenylation specificity factor complex [Stemphylium lycopersici]|uniref:Mrna cleavage and polyadenylation specificity factor complex n=1 Tax=Stemphylium lycopersici TaxID=183478 RepID=A0A364MXT3_STELY|nr:mrna cleavage and polyadenylation specificity factor complex [Stemphylium lycopersici]RAR06777.1 mrna cleavage and polyadenylation specificity factor complex [Stemphylium lycopersici]
MSSQTIQQMESARSLALGDGRYYPTIIPGVLPIIGYSEDQSIEIQRWGADFLAEAFASPTWPQEVKQSSAPSVLATLKAYLENIEDKSVIKSAIQAAASVYPLVYKHTVSDPSDAQNWQLMAGIKSNILRRMDSAAPGVRICCVKFLQQVVLVQTPSVADPRVNTPPVPTSKQQSHISQRADHNDISLSLVPRDHPLIPLGMLIHRRPNAANKILNSVFNFNPLKLANSPMTPKNKVIMKSIERTTRALLINIMKRNPENPVNGRIQQFLERMHRTRIEVFDESNRKRPAPTEPTDGLDHAKRQRLVAEPPSRTPSVQPLPPGEVSWRQLYTLNSEGSTANFDVQNFKDPEQLLRIVVPVLQSVNPQKLEQAISAVRARYQTLRQNAASLPAQPPNPPAAEDEEEYEPDFEPEDAEQLINKLDGLPSNPFPSQSGPSTALAPYKLPEAPPLSEQDVQKYGDMTVHRAFGMLSSVDETQKSRTTKGGFNRLAATDYNRDAWITILSRLATRASAGLDDPDEGIKDEYAVKSARGNTKISDSVRDGLYQYILYDWKRRIDVAISWLNEEWYNDMVLTQIEEAPIANGTVNGVPPSKPPRGNYHRCALRLIDGILPYIEHTDKILLRFLSEIPSIDYTILVRLKKMAEDPERIDLACNALHYLYMFRPPVRKIVVDILAEMWHENDRAKPSARKLLVRWRPEVLNDEKAGTPLLIKTESTGGEGQAIKESANGALEVKAAS